MRFDMSKLKEISSQWETLEDAEEALRKKEEAEIKQKRCVWLVAAVCRLFFFPRFFFTTFLLSIRRSILLKKNLCTRLSTVLLSCCLSVSLLVIYSRIDMLRTMAGRADGEPPKLRVPFFS